MSSLSAALMRAQLHHGAVLGPASTMVSSGVLGGARVAACLIAARRLPCDDHRWPPLSTHHTHGELSSCERTPMLLDWPEMADQEAVKSPVDRASTGPSTVYGRGLPSGRSAAPSASASASGSSSSCASCSSCFSCFSCYSSGSTRSSSFSFSTPSTFALFPAASIPLLAVPTPLPLPLPSP
jgi:hypothetical protein